MERQGPLLTIIIPSKNEENDIARCLDSLMAHACASMACEVILVDCASTDQTVALAKRFPVKIVQLKPDWFHSASAARYIGGRYASGEFVFFIDADMALAQGFLERAIEALRRDPVISAVGGAGREVYLKEEKESGSNPDLYRTKNSMRQVRFLGGAALYRRTHLLGAGGFNPYLIAGEERELAQRLREKGYLLVSIPYPMITHYTADLKEWDEFVRKRKMRLFFGIGQALRLSRSFGYLFEALCYYKEFSFFLLFITFNLAVVIISVFLKVLSLLYLVVFSTGSVILLVLLKKKSFSTAFQSLAKWAIIGCDITRGFFKRIPSFQAYPVDPVIIKGEFDVKK